MGWHYLFSLWLPILRAWLYLARAVNQHSLERCLCSHPWPHVITACPVLSTVSLAIFRSLFLCGVRLVNHNFYVSQGDNFRGRQNLKHVRGKIKCTDFVFYSKIFQNLSPLDTHDLQTFAEYVYACVKQVKVVFPDIMYHTNVHSIRSFNSKDDESTQM